ncbi:hypothetical protein FQR65_LT11771 [Abscondita terminalis]|nr:hypothetical protein FQR65_LT11771 [Abscondita terminalis]
MRFSNVRSVQRIPISCTIYTNSGALQIHLVLAPGYTNLIASKVMELLKVMRGNLAIESNCNAAEEILSLIKSGYDVNAVTELGVTALHFAISRNMPDVAQTLIDHGADINLPQDHSESTPLQLAVRFRNRELVCMLLCYGADVTAVDCYKMTPLMTALNMGENEIARILFDITMILLK